MQARALAREAGLLTDGDLSTMANGEAVLPAGGTWLCTHIHICTHSHAQTQSTLKSAFRLLCSSQDTAFGLALMRSL